MADEEHINGIRALAWEHQGQYLLPRRLRPDPFNKTDTDLDYDACEELVRRGEARWLSGYSTEAPGIQIVRAPIKERQPTPMPLEEALSRLAAVHTRDDDVVGWSVTIGATPDPFMMERGDYVRAWETVRRYLHLQIDPPT